MKKRLIITCIIIFSIVTMNSCSPFATPGRTVLAPTPLALVYGKNANVSDLKDENLSKSVPVFICSSRNLEPHGDRVDPFGNKRSEKLVPYLALAQVSIGKNTSKEELLRETLTSVKKKRSRVKVESFKMFESPNVTPFSSMADKKRKRLSTHC